MFPYAMFAVPAGLWLASIVACVVAFRWSFLSVSKRFWPAAILSLSALLLAYLGMTRFRIVSTTTVNGQVKWRFDSSWLFVSSLVLGATVLVYTIWKRTRTTTRLK